MDRYKRSISRKNKIYCPYTLDGIGNFYFFAGHGLLPQCVARNFVRCRLLLRSRLQCHRFLRTFVRQTIPKFYIFAAKIADHEWLCRRVFSQPFRLRLLRLQ